MLSKEAHAWHPTPSSHREQSGSRREGLPRSLGRSVFPGNVLFFWVDCMFYFLNILVESEVGTYSLNCTSKEDMRLLSTHSVLYVQEVVTLQKKLFNIFASENEDFLE